jgi:hypothetical protein
MLRSEFIWLRIGSTDGCCEDGKEPSGLIEIGYFINQLSGYGLPKEDSAFWSTVVVCLQYTTYS